MRSWCLEQWVSLGGGQQNAEFPLKVGPGHELMMPVGIWLFTHAPAPPLPPPITLLNWACMGRQAPSYLPPSPLHACSEAETQKTSEEQMNTWKQLVTISFIYSHRLTS